MYPRPAGGCAFQSTGPLTAVYVRCVLPLSERRNNKSHDSNTGVINRYPTEKGKLLITEAPAKVQAQLQFLI